MKLYAIEITRCLDCPDREFLGFGAGNWCKRSDKFPSDIQIIPEWCELKDVDRRL